MLRIETIGVEVGEMRWGFGGRIWKCDVMGFVFMAVFNFLCYRIKAIMCVRLATSLSRFN